MMKVWRDWSPGVNLLEFRGSQSMSVCVSVFSSGQYSQTNRVRDQSLVVSMGREMPHH